MALADRRRHSGQIESCLEAAPMKLAIALLAASLAFGGAATAQPQHACDKPQNAQFDFWVGRWRVAPNGHPDRPVATSVIEKLYQGCAIRENWAPLAGGGGGSLSSYVLADDAWQQTWVDSSGARVEFKGGWNGAAMVLTGVWPQPGHPTQITRMTYSRQPNGSVRQLGETSDDGGRTWQAGFDFIYRKAD
jgi:hypothetical protein